ncbi:MAG: hypothetical protein AABY10_00015 [Nanoarchaeota archaeon]
MKNNIMKKINSKDKGEVVWRDNRIIDNVLTIISIVGILFGGYILLIMATTYIEKIESILIILVCIIVTYSQIIRKLSFICTEGIFIGNASLKEWNSLNLIKRIFLKWKDVRYLKLENHEVKVSKGSWCKTFIVITTKRNKKYQCVVYDPKGFIQALKKLKKYHLLSKDSKYR